MIVAGTTNAAGDADDDDDNDDVYNVGNDDMCLYMN